MAGAGDGTEAGSPPDRKLHSTSSSGRPSGFLKKSMNTHPRGAGALFAEAAANASRNHFPRRPLMPSTPSFHAGNPNPFAITGGNASGNEPAEKNEIFSVGWVYPPLGGNSTELASSNFSGMFVKVLMLYLSHSECIVYIVLK